MRFVTNVLSTIVLAPPLLTFLGWRALPRPLGPPVAEFLILLTGLTASERLVNTLATPVTISPLLFAPLPFLLWAAVRFGQAGLGIVLCFTTLFRYFAGAHPGQGLATPPDAIVATQLTLIAMSLPLIVLSALLSERRSAEEALRTGPLPLRPRDDGRIGRRVGLEPRHERRLRRSVSQEHPGVRGSRNRQPRR